jgi:hypothetical protein
MKNDNEYSVQNLNLKTVLCPLWHCVTFLNCHFLLSKLVQIVLEGLSAVILHKQEMGSGLTKDRYELIPTQCSERLQFEAEMDGLRKRFCVKMTWRKMSLYRKNTNKCHNSIWALSSYNVQ